MTDLQQAGLDAVDAFITTWNSRDAVRWAGSLNFPHVRPAPRGPILVSADADEYVSRVDFDKVVATGWDHSEWDYRHVLHTSPRKIHVVGQWCRFNAAGEKLLTNPVTYIATKVDGDWGIQSRFSADFAGDEDTSGFEGRCFKLVETFATHLAAGRRDACAELMNYPLFDIRVGEIVETKVARDYVLPDYTLTIESMMALQTGRLSMNLGAEFLMDSRVDGGGEGSALRQAVLNLTERDGHLGIQAISMLDPNEPEED